MYGEDDYPSRQPAPTAPTRQPRGRRTLKPPSIATMNKWVNEGVARATDGCRVEPDGHCPHGKASWLLELCLI